MERFGRRVEFGVASFHRCHSLSCRRAESTHPDAQKAAMRCKEESQRPKCSHPAEMPVIPEQAMEFLSRSWSPPPRISSKYSLPVLQGASPEDRQEDETTGDGDEEKHLDTVLFAGGNGQLFNQTWRVLASAKPSSAQRQPNWLNIGHMRAILRGYFLNSVSVTGSRRRMRRRDELRLNTAQAHAAVSVAQLAAAIAGIVSACEVRPASSRSIEAAAGDKRMSTVLASAAALVATICAEAAETAGANRSRVTSAVNTGLESRSSAELLTLTAAAATCLRGAAALKLRADVRGISNKSSMSISTSIQKGATLRVCLPYGRVRPRTVAIFPQRDTVALRLGKKRLHGAFTTYEDYEVLAVLGDGRGGGETVVDGRGFFPVALSTSAGTVQLLLDDQTHCKVWRASIEGILSEQKLKHSKN